MDIERIRRHVANISTKLREAEEDDGYGGVTLADLHDALFVGVTVLEQEMGCTLFEAPSDHDMAARSGGSGKERPDVSGQ